MRATVYTETVVISPPERYAADAPYQLAIVQYEDGTKQTVRITGERVVIGDIVVLVGNIDGIARFQKDS
jgi:uncharacterized OB-fold protein